MASLAADAMSSQSDRKPGVPALDGQKERILGQRHDLNKCTLHDSPRTWTLTRIGRCVKGLAIFADALREPLLAVTAVFGPAPWAGAPSTHVWPARRSFSARFRWPYARMTLTSTETLITPQPAHSRIGPCTNHARPQELEYARDPPHARFLSLKFSSHG